MLIHRQLRFGVGLAVALMCSSTVATATDDSVKAAVRELSIQGKEDFDAGRFDAASQKFQRALDVAKVPTLALWSARCANKLGHLVAAAELYRKALQLAPNDLWVGDAQPLAQGEAQQELDALLPRIPKLRIDVVGSQPSEVAIAVDNVALPSALAGVDRPTDPGQRRVTGKRGAEVADLVVALKEGETKSVILKFSGAPLVPIATAPVATPNQPNPPVSGPVATSIPIVSPPRDSDSSVGATQRTLGWIGLGVGAAGVIEGAVTGIFVIQRYSKIKDNCGNGICDPNMVDGYRLDMYNALRTASTVGFVVGGIGLAAGTTLLLTSPSSKPQVGVLVGPGSAGLHGVF